MECTFDNDRPIYLQLVEMLKIEIISGRLKAGEQIFTVRDAALKFKVNPNTVQKSLQELESIGLIYTERTTGKFVTTNTKLIQKVKNEFAKEKVDKYLSDMQNLGFDKDEAIIYLDRERK